LYNLIFPILPLKYSSPPGIFAPTEINASDTVVNGLTPNDTVEFKLPFIYQLTVFDEYVR
jgi:hypothetical protein